MQDLKYKIVEYDRPYRVWNNGKIEIIAKNSKSFDIGWKEIKGSKIGGFRIIKPMIDGKRKVRRIVYLVAKLFVSNPENKKFVIFKNGDINDYNTENLEWSNYNSTSNTSNLSEKTVLEIRKRYYDDKIEIQDLSKEFKMKKGTIRQIATGKTWRHLIPRQQKYFENNYLLKTFPLPIPEIQDISIEKWKDIKGFNGNYQASNQGRLRSRLNTTGEIQSDWIIVTGSKDKDGYFRIPLRTEFNRKKNFIVSRLIAMTWIPNSNPQRKYVNHHNSDRSENNINNLVWCTSRENKIHQMIHNNQNYEARGASSGLSALSEDRALKTFLLLELGVFSIVEIAKLVDVSGPAVQQIKNRSTWTDYNGLPFLRILQDRKNKIFKPIQEYRNLGLHIISNALQS